MYLVLKYSYMQKIIMRQLVLWDCRTSILTKMEASGLGVIVLASCLPTKLDLLAIYLWVFVVSINFANLLI